MREQRLVKTRGRSAIAVMTVAGLTLGVMERTQASQGRQADVVAVTAPADSTRGLTEIASKSFADSIDFWFRVGPGLTPDQVTVHADGSALSLRLAGVEVRRRWVKLVDRDVVRTLLHPSRFDRSAAVLRVRLAKKIPEIVLEQVKIERQGEWIIAKVPRTELVAELWAAEASEPAPVEVTAAPTPPEPTETATNRLLAMAADAPPPAAPAPNAEAAPIPAPEPLALLDEPEPFMPSSAASTSPADNAVAMPAYAESNGILWTLAAVLGLLAIAFVWLRRIKQSQKVGGRDKLIRPLATHFLGPKHGLLLVDVAGEVVLLATGEKGVEMLTKIEPIAVPEAESEVAPVRVAAPATRDSIGGGFGRVLQKVRAAARRADPAPVPLTAPGPIADGDDALARALAAGTEAEAEAGMSAGAGPGEFAPALSRGVDRDILDRIRQLQGA